MKKLLIIGLILVGAVALLACAAVLVLAMTAWAGKGRVASRTILEWDFERPVVEYVPEESFAAALMKPPVTTREVVDALLQAADDPKVVALVARVGVPPMGLAQVQEIRDAVQEFRKSGKPAVAWAETMGEFGPGNSAYYLATAFDTIYLQPSGDVGLTGLIAESPFLRGTLEKMGVDPRFDHRKEYKNAMNLFTEKRFTDAHREATLGIVNAQFAQMVRGIAQARGITEDQVRGLMDRGPFLGAEAVEAKLVDELAFRDEVYAKIREKVGSKANLLYLDRYLERAGHPHSRGKTLALIYGVGGVARGASGWDPVMSENTMGSDTVTAAFRSAVDDREVKAILFRVDSPGGSAVASDCIWREVVRARKAGKPVIVSMGNVAGSGGYWIAMSADKIVAQPATITGSIGVLGGKMLTSGMWDKVGISWDEVHTSANATMWTGTSDYSAAEWERFQAMLDRIYADFIRKVSEGRNLPPERVETIARGRIWSGEDAKGLGLVDELGGLETAIRLAKQAVKIAPEEGVRLKVFPRKRSPWEAFFAKGPDSSEDRAEVRVAARWIEALRPYVRLARSLGIGPPRGVVSMAEPEPAR